VSGVVVDTSVWIDFFAGRPLPALEQALAQGSVVLPPIVLAELVSGAKSRRERALVEDLANDLEVHQTPVEHWVAVGELRGELRKKGFTVSISDVHVAQCAIDRNAILLTGDSVFEEIARLAPLQLGTI